MHAQEQLYYGRLSDDENMLDAIMEMGHAVKRWNPAILATDEDSTARKVRRFLCRAAHLLSPTRQQLWCNGKLHTSEAGALHDPFFPA